MTERLADDLNRRLRQNNYGDPRLPKLQVPATAKRKNYRDTSHRPDKLELETLNLIASLKNPEAAPKKQKVVVPKVDTIPSGYRGPACNFLCDVRPSTANDSTSPLPCSDCSMPQRSPRSSRGRRISFPQEVVTDEASDLVVWNPSKKTSRSNMLCPLTDSEFRRINSSERQKLTEPRPNAEPAEFQDPDTDIGGDVEDSIPIPVSSPSCAGGSMNLKVNSIDKGDPDLINDCDPHSKSPGKVSPSPSAASASTTYSVQISLVTQQLEEIQQAQNDVLKQLGEEIQKMNDENERLQKEIEHVRSQNDNLVKTIHETNEELERMKHILRIRGLSPPLTDASFEDDSESATTADHKDNAACDQLKPKQGKPMIQPVKLEAHEMENKSVQESTKSTPKYKPKSSLKSADPKEKPGKTRELTPKSLMSKKITDGGDVPQPNINDQVIPSVPGKEKLDDVRTENELKSTCTDSSSGKQSSARRHHHHHDSHRHHHRHRSRSQSSRRSSTRGRSKSKSPQSSPEREKKRFEDDCDDTFELERGCFSKFFSCCWANGRRTDSVDDLALRDGGL